MLRPLYTNKATHLLLVGPPSSGKRTLANQLLKSTKIFYSMHLLEEIKTDLIDRVVDINYVILIVDMTNPASMTLLEQALKHLSPEYLLYKCSIVFTKVDMTDIWMLNEDQIRAGIQQYGNPMTFYVNLKDTFMRKKICDQLTQAISIGTFQQRKVHPLGILFMDTYFTKNGGNNHSNKDGDDHNSNHADNNDYTENPDNNDYTENPDNDDYTENPDNNDYSENSNSNAYNDNANSNTYNDNANINEYIDKADLDKNSSRDINIGSNSSSVPM